LEDKYQGTRMILDMLMGGFTDRSLASAGRSRRGTSIEAVLENGFWAGMTLYPVTKCTPQRAADMIERYGPERLMAELGRGLGTQVDRPLSPT
jgi:predicted metal-dependent TIM-barrel fold hydrolase